MSRQSNLQTRGRGFWDITEVPLITTALILATIWIVPLIVSSESGWRFGLPFRAFYSVIAVVGGMVFILLKTAPPRPVSSTRGVLVSISLIYLITVGSVVLVAQAFPQFQAEAVDVDLTSAVERGKAAFNTAPAGCFLCHKVEGVGGTRGPDQTNIGERAATRRPGLSAEEYIRESVLNPNAYVVEPFGADVMPSDFGARLTEEMINDLVVYLLSLK